MKKSTLFELKDEDLRQLLREELQTTLREQVKDVKESANLSKLISRQNLAEYFDVSLVTIDKWVTHKVLPAPFKLGNRVYFRKAEIAELTSVKSNS